MAFIDLYRTQKSEILQLTLKQIASLLDDGRVKDGSTAINHFRAFLEDVPPEKLEEYAYYCLNQKFDQSGQFLQDIVNEAGRRIGYKVENGLYQGVRNSIGFDGIWSNKKNSIVVEVKTSDVHTISLKIINEYFDKLTAQKKINADNSSILIVVGHSNTGSLEDSIRGNINSHRIRVISVESLFQLLGITVKTAAPRVIANIQQLLIPIDYVKLDQVVTLLSQMYGDIVEVSSRVPTIKNTSKEKKSDNIHDATTNKVASSNLVLTESDERKRLIIKKVQNETGLILNQQRFSLYKSSDKNVNFVVIGSKYYDDDDTEHGSRLYDYQFTITLQQLKHLQKTKNGFLLAACGNDGKGLMISKDNLLNLFNNLPESDNGGGARSLYLYVQKDHASALITKSGKSVDLSNFMA